MDLNLVALNGPQAGQVHRLAQGQLYTLGRDKACTLQLDDPEAASLHARISHDGRNWRVEDCGTQQGVQVNAHPTRRSKLRPGDLLSIGKLWLALSIEQCAFDSPEVVQSCRIFGAGPLEQAQSGDADPMLSALAELVDQLTTAKSPGEACDQLLRCLQRTLGATARICRLDASGSVACIAGSQQVIPDVLAPWVIQRRELLVVQLNQQAITPLTKEKPLTGNTASLAVSALEGATESYDSQAVLAVGVPVPSRPATKHDTAPLCLECYFHSAARSQAGSSTPLSPDTLVFLKAASDLFAAAVRRLDNAARAKPAATNAKSRSHSPRATPRKSRRPLPRAAADKRSLQLPGVSGTAPIVGDSAAVRRLIDQIDRVAPTDATVLVLGESGTGKELVAQSIHDNSSRREGPFVTVNCAAFSDSLLESELFGHEKGAFTGADARRQGKFELADKGTIFLDEVGELSETCQAQLLRLLEGQPFYRVGGATPVQSNVRIVAATNRDLVAMVRDGRFREDLWYRLRVIELQTPPLRERMGDVATLARHFLIQELEHCTAADPPTEFSDESLQAMKTYAWPGNIRELKHAVARAVVLGTSPKIEPDDLGIQRDADLAISPNVADIAWETLAANERRHIERVLRSVDGNKTEACRILGIGRATLYSKLSKS